MANKNQKSDSVHVKLINFIRWLAQQIQPLKLKKFRYVFGLLLLLNLVLKLVQEPFFCTLLYYLFFTTMFFSYFDTLFENQVLFQLKQEKETSKRLSALLKIEETKNIEKIKNLTEAKEEISRNAQKSAKIFQHQLKQTKMKLKNAKQNYEEQARRQGIYSVIYLTKMKQQIEQLQYQLSSLTEKQKNLTGNSTNVRNQRSKNNIISIIIQKFEKLQNSYQSQFKQFKAENNSPLKWPSQMNTICLSLNKQVWQKTIAGMSEDEQIQKIMDYSINTLNLIMLTLLRERKQSVKMLINYENSLIRIKNIFNANFRSFTNSDQYDIQNNQNKVQGITKRVIHLFESLNIYKKSIQRAEQIMSNKDQQIQDIIQTRVNHYRQLIYKLGNQNEQIKIGYEQIIKNFQVEIQRLNKEKENNMEKKREKEKEKEKEKKRAKDMETVREREKEKEREKGREKEKEKGKEKGKETSGVKNLLLTPISQNNSKDSTKLLKIENVKNQFIYHQEISEQE